MVALLDERDALFALEFSSAGDRVPRPGAELWRGSRIEWQPRQSCEVVRQVGAYFDGSLDTFELGLARRGSEFQQRVWAQLQLVPYGETITYLGLAKSVGRPSASRAAGSANAANPFAIVVPCHRVVGSTGQLRGYAGGIELKSLLLAHERRHRRCPIADKKRPPLL